MVGFLKGDLDVFVWSAYEALGVDPKFICHHLNVNPKATPKKQLPRRSFKEHAKAVKSRSVSLNRLGQLKRFSTLNGWLIPWW